MADFAKLRQRLLAEKKRLNVELQQQRTEAPALHSDHEGSPYGKREDEATGASELEKRLALEQQLLAALAEVEHALKKLEDGTYVRCDQCGQPISPERLEALPHATLCMKCKSQARSTPR